MALLRPGEWTSQPVAEKISDMRHGDKFWILWIVGLTVFTGLLGRLVGATSRMYRQLHSLGLMTSAGEDFQIGMDVVGEANNYYHSLLAFESPTRDA
jgi:hypothetical protein